MKKIGIIYIGKPQYQGVEQLGNLFLKRIAPHINIEEVFIKENNKKEYSTEIQDKIKNLTKSAKTAAEGKYSLISCTPEGKMMDSFEFSSLIFDKIFFYHDYCVFIVGNKEGVPEQIKKISDYSLSFSKMEFGHQIFRIMILEQIYRSVAIKNNLNYI